MSIAPTRHAGIAALVVADDLAGLADTIGAVHRQVYEGVRVAIVGAVPKTAADSSGETAEHYESVGSALEAMSDSVDYFWILRDGAIPLPDALASLVTDAERTYAGIIGSKIVGDSDALVSVGLATDVFDVPYTGLDRSELDQGQYDVVRDVAAVAGVSLLVRRDLLLGLGGVDPDLAPMAASIDLAQRARLKGARIMVSPASEVAFDLPEYGSVRWREQASRIRSIAKVYSPLTLLWVLPIDFLIGLLAAFISLFFGRWQFFDLIKAWAWNIAKIPSTWSARHRARHDRVVGDAELFRYQRRGSVTISVLIHESLSAIRKRLPGDDSLSVASVGRDVRQPAFVVGALAVVFVLLSARDLWWNGLPAVGYTLPFPASGWDALVAYAGGWNPAGLGSAEALRPLLAVAGAAEFVTFNSGNFAEYVMGAGAMLLGIWGITRLLRTWSIAAAPALLAGIVYVAGPMAQGIGNNTHIGTLLGLGLLPWALRVCLAPLREGWRPVLGRLAAAALVFGLLGALAPLLLILPVPVLLLYALFRFSDGNAWRAVATALMGTAAGALLLSPWLWEISFEAIARAGYAYWNISPVLAVAGALVAAAAVIAAPRPLGVVAGWGSVVAAGGFAISRGGEFGLGTEAESAGLAMTSLGVAVTVGIVAYTVSRPETATWRRFVTGVGSVGIVFLVVSATVILLGGRIGLPGDRFEEMLAFTEANEGEAELMRVLLVGPADMMPGDSRSILGGSYRVVSAPVPDLGEARLASRGALDDYLYEKLDLIISGETLRAGGELASFGIRWIVVLGDSDGADADETSLAWRQVFAGQLDLLPLSAGIKDAVFVTDIDPVGRALTSTAHAWPRAGWTYEGPPEVGKRVLVADNPDPGFGPGQWREIAFANEVSAHDGVVTYSSDAARQRQAILAAVAVILLLGVSMWGRRQT